MAKHRIRDEEIDELMAENDLYEDDLFSDSANDVESCDNDYIPPTPPEQRNSKTAPIVCVPVSDDS
jgi:hypothetical protein